MSSTSNPFIRTTQFARGDAIVNSFAVLFLLVAASYSRNLLSCDIQDALTNNVYYKHFIGFCLLLYFVVLTERDRFITYKVDEWITPKLLAITLIIYLLFLFAGRMQSNYAVFIIGAALVYKLLDIEKDNKTGLVREGQTITFEQLKDQKTIISFIQQLLWYLICIMVVLGVGSYYMKQKQDHAVDFDHFKFLFGTPKCQRFETH
jgi:hypothetical protein